jgi:OmpA-OmpF porin, OOP family
MTGGPPRRPTGVGGRRRRATARASAGLALAVVAGVPSLAAAQTPEVLDPFDGQPPTVTADDIAASITVLEPVVRPLEVPEPRGLREDGDGSTVTVSSDVLFGFDSADLTGAADATLTTIAADLGAVSGPIAVVGHTDAVGTEAYNQDLSEQRAEAVAEVLRAELGDVEVSTEGRSFREPVVEESDDDPSLAARNRRVEISVD